MDPSLTDAGTQADALAVLLHQQPDLEILVTAEDAAAASLVEAGLDLWRFLPATEEIGLGFRGGERPSGRTILRAYRDALRSDLCDPEAELYKKTGAAVSTGGAAVVGLLLAALGLPAEAGDPRSPASAISYILSGRPMILATTINQRLMRLRAAAGTAVRGRRAGQVADSADVAQVGFAATRSRTFRGRGSSASGQLRAGEAQG